ncbi:bifunctional phosphopantothenoylcysteine decarboxylase/phosphopantothenate--cysteine ligase CoaBC [Brooklawnia propionicigenes]|uniref:Coenzyme A biosynthesis bifunctional protein CoaBC n=1 Tax=Brooklawnia propionicigenes TaxID=3041175 RepID=A0AAN0K5T4_9ACTN|nr:bifunctional phosphopantothenoylcysteine decarboxylase/phosphopantothenate--cysteine ligase CoaBC [Brooklawnia sp. SH051]BEH00948.1 bifunctional phosphopantothenoylcysteine decarboxylase/phosphopantothenate--cysteine ligase CoaBC [Brooklawnia sp. SH051]
MNIVLGVSGGIAAYKAVMVARLLVEAGHDVQVVPTEDALHFVGKPTWEAISRHPVTASVHENVAEVRHVALGQHADLIIVAPATANTLARMAAGIADNLLGTTLLATEAPVLVAPAMHTQMWLHPATQANIATLRTRGIEFVGPNDGRLTGTDSGPGRMSEPDEIVTRAFEILARTSLTSGDLAGVKLLVSAGGTREPIDPVRFIGNRSSGRQGVALAAAAAARGADVVLLAANIEDAILSEVSDCANVRIDRTGTATEMDAAANREADDADVIVMAAAVSDYRVAGVRDTKMRKEDTGTQVTLTLTENPDILAGLVHRRRPGQLVVGFAAETAENQQALLALGRQKLARKGADLLAVNAVGWSEGFETTENTLYVLAVGGELVATASGSKREAADGLLDAIVAARQARS